MDLDSYIQLCRQWGEAPYDYFKSLLTNEKEDSRNVAYDFFYHKMRFSKEHIKELKYEQQLEDEKDKQKLDEHRSDLRKYYERSSL